MAILKNLNINGTGYIKMPSGTTAQRPASAEVGMLRYNTDFGVVEAYTPGGWRSDYGKRIDRPANSAKEINDNFPGNKTGFYYLKGVNNIPFYTICDMTGDSAGSSVGGWALINEGTVAENRTKAIIDTPRYYTAQTDGSYTRNTAQDSVMSGVRWDLGTNIQFSGVRVTYAYLDTVASPDGSLNDIASSTPTAAQILTYVTTTVDFGSNKSRFGFAGSNGTDVVKLYNGTAAGEYPSQDTNPVILSQASFPGGGDSNLSQGSGRYLYWYFADGPSEYYALRRYSFWVR